MSVVRFADDFIVGFQRESDAGRFLEALRERLRKFSLELHPDKTRLIRFGAFAALNRRERGEGKPETFDFLGFTHICGRTRDRRFLLLRHTIAKRMRATLHAVKAAVMRRRDDPVPAQGRWLDSVVRGYFAYYAVPTNSEKLAAFRTQVLRAWLHALRRRSQRDQTTWERISHLADRWIPRPRVQHPWPNERFDVRTQGRSPVR
jgi:hypothetical protein